MSDLVQVVIPPLPSALTYEVPADLNPKPVEGFIVEVPLGKRKALGYVISGHSSKDRSSTFQIKAISSCPLKYAAFTPEQLSFFQWVAEYHAEQLSSVIDLAVPAAVPPRFERSYEFIGNIDNISARSQRQRELAEYLIAHGPLVSYSLLQRTFKNCSALLKKMEQAGFLKSYEEEQKNHHLPSEPAPAWAKGTVKLNQAQQIADERIAREMNTNTFQTFVLHGVTGSGKTEVYLSLIERALAAQKGALVIVPEIALTPQLIDRFRARLNTDISMLHSGMPKRARWDAWRALLEGRSKIALGARSAIFAPVHNLGIVIVDEEHDSSFKQSEGLRYNGRDLALVRAKMHSCPVVLGSATPSLESYHHARTGRYEYLELPGRHQSASNLTIESVDLNLLRPWEMKSKNISPVLFDQISETLERKEQVFILYNRRGFSSYLQCERCESVVECPNCSVTLTYHQRSNQLVCHYCNLHVLRPKYCSSCSNAQDASSNPEKEQKPALYVDRGAGTEKVFDELKQLFPDSHVLRLDRDAVSTMDQYTEILDQVRSGACDILVGTQMIAKGHDLPEVTLVGVVDCDIGLHMPDFRAGERVFQLLTQVAGRAGRGAKAGKVILQTRVPNSPSLKFTLEQNYRGFAERELLQRKSLHYPPYFRLLRILCKAPGLAIGLQVLDLYKQYCLGLCENLGIQYQILGPAPASIERIKAEWRSHLIIKTQRASQLSRLCAELRNVEHGNSKVKVLFDIDPQDML